MRISKFCLIWKIVRWGKVYGLVIYIKLWIVLPGVDWVELTTPQNTVTPVSEYDLLTLGNVNFEVS